jgi:hypothetical protein
MTVGHRAPFRWIEWARTGAHFVLGFCASALSTTTEPKICFWLPFRTCHYLIVFVGVTLTDRDTVLIRFLTYGARAVNDPITDAFGKIFASGIY